MKWGVILLAVGSLGTGCSTEDSPGSSPELARSGESGTQRPQIEQPGSPQAGLARPVRGVVYDADGSPLPGARVTLYRRLREWPRRDRDRVGSVLSGASGEFLFGTLRSDDLEVEVQAPFADLADLIVPAPEAVPNLQLHLGPGFRVEGRVRLPSGFPAESCEVHLEPSVGSLMRAVMVRTDRDGTFVFTGVPAEHLRISARHPDYQPVGVPAVTVGRLREYIIRFEESGLGLSGVVISSETGEPLEGCEVRVFPLAANGALYAPYTATTGSDGSYTVRGLGRGSYTLEVWHRNHSFLQRSISLSKSRTDLNLELTMRVRARGRITGGSAQPRKLTLTSAFGEVATTVVDSDGSFEFAGTGFSRGLATLELEESEFCFAQTQSRWLRVPLIGREDLDLELRVASIVKGRVVGPDGSPVAGVRVLSGLSQLNELGLLARDRRVLAVSDEQGMYTIRGLAPGDVRLFFEKDDFAYAQKLATASMEEVDQGDMILRKPGTISGRVTQGPDPVAGALVSVVQSVSTLSRAITDTDGRFTLRGLPDGNHLVRVKFATLPIAHSDEAIHVAPEEAVVGVEVFLPPGRRIEGVVIDEEEEEPMANVVVETPEGTSTTTDASGGFALDVTPRSANLFFRPENSDVLLGTYLVPRGAETVEIILPRVPRSGLRGMVLELPSEKPTSGLILRLDRGSREDTAVEAFSLQDPIMVLVSKFLAVSELNRQHERGDVERWVETSGGAFELESLPSGTFRLTIQAKGYQPFILDEVELIEGQTRDLKVVELKPGGKVSGVVVGPDGRPVRDAWVVLGRESDLNLQGTRARYRTDEEGRFVVSGVGLRLSRLYVSASGLATQYVDLDLPRDILRQDPVLVEMQPGATIKVTVIDPEGDPSPFEVVQLNRGFERIRSVETNEQGIAWFPNLAVGTYHLFLRGYSSLTTQEVRDTSGAKVYPLSLRRQRWH